LEQAEVILDDKFDRQRNKSIKTIKKKMDRNEDFQKRKVWVEQTIQKAGIHFENILKKHSCGVPHEHEDENLDETNS